MAKNNIISFSDYLKRKRSEFSIDTQFLKVLGSDIKSKPALSEWYNFQNIFNRHKLFLHALYASDCFFTDNHNLSRNQTSLKQTVKEYDDDYEYDYEISTG